MDTEQKSVNIICDFMHFITLVPEVYFYYFHCEGRGKISLWLKAAIDSSSRANQFELGSDPDSVSCLDDCIKAI